MDHNKKAVSHVKVTEIPPTQEIGESLLTGVILAAVLEEGQRPGVWQGMIQALNRGAAGTRAGTADAFLFQAMVDRLLAEFRAADPGKERAKQ